MNKRTRAAMAFASKKAPNWSSPETFSLISCFSKVAVELESTNRRKSIYEQIHNEMIELGHTRFTYEQIVYKLQDLRQKYRIVNKEYGPATGIQAWPFFENLHKIYAELPDRNSFSEYCSGSELESELETDYSSENKGERCLKSVSTDLANDMEISSESLSTERVDFETVQSDSDYPFVRDRLRRKKKCGKERKRICVKMTTTRDFEQKKLLIAEVEKRPILWDRRLLEHRDLTKLHSHWLAISAAMGGCLVADIRNQWRNIKDQFRRQHKKLMQVVQSVSSMDELRQKADFIRWKLFKYLLFLHPIFINNGSQEFNKKDRVDLTAIENQKPQEILCEVAVDETILDDSNNFLARTSVSGSTSSERSAEFQMTKGNKRKQSIQCQLPVSKKKSTPNETFGFHVCDLIAQVPEELKMNCMQSITNMISAFIESKVPVVTFPPSDKDQLCNTNHERTTDHHKNSEMVLNNQESIP